MHLSRCSSWFVLRRSNEGLIKGLLLLLAAAAALALVNPEHDTGVAADMSLGRCQVASVRDGDTLVLSCQERDTLRVRLWGVDAPELGQAPWGQQAHRYLARRAVGQVWVESVDLDRYGRLVARLYQGPQDLGLDLVGAGWAKSMPGSTAAATTSPREMRHSRAVGVYGRHPVCNNPPGSGGRVIRAASKQDAPLGKRRWVRV